MTSSDGVWTAHCVGYEKYSIHDERGTEIGFVHRKRDAERIERLTRTPNSKTTSDEDALSEAYKRGWGDGCETMIEDYPDALIAVPHKDAMTEGCANFMAEVRATPPNHQPTTGSEGE